MKINTAITERILKLCKERNITINKLADLSLITQSTLSNIVNGNSNDPKILTIVRVCEGLEISLAEFFDDNVFNNIDRED